MAIDLAAEPAIVVAQLGKFMSQRAEYDLYRPDGTAVGAVTEQESLGGIFARKLSTLRFVITDTDGGTVASIEKPGAFGRSSFLLYDADDQQVGAIDQDNLAFAPEFTVTTATGSLRLTSASLVMAQDWQLEDDRGTVVATVSREFAGLADIFTSAERYVVQLSEALAGGDRIAALCACVCLDVVRDLKRQQHRGPAL